MIEYSETQLAYLAGLIDADGSIDLRLKKAGNLLLRAQVYNTDRQLMDWLSLTFGGHVHRVGRRDVAHWKPEYTWYLNGQGAVEMLSLVAPYMHVKRSRAELAIEAWARRDPTPIADRRKPMREGLVEMRQGYVDQMRELNKKGRAS